MCKFLETIKRVEKISKTRDLRVSTIETLFLISIAIFETIRITYLTIRVKICQAFLYGKIVFLSNFAIRNTIILFAANLLLKKYI